MCRVKKSIDKAQQDEAFKELLKVLGKNGGKIPYGKMDKLVKTYNLNGFKAVTQDSLYYRLKKYKRGNHDDSTKIHEVTVVTTSLESQGVISDLTDEIVTSNVSNIDQDTPVNIGGRKKGSTKAATKEKVAKQNETVTKCAILYKSTIEEARKAGLSNVPNGTLRKIINEEELKAGLSVNSISLDTVRSRVKRGNPDAYNESQQSPIKELEPIICELCIRLGKMGRPLTKTTIIELANDIVLDTEYQSKIVECKELRRLTKTEKLGDAWYRGFMHRFDDALT